MQNEVLFSVIMSITTSFIILGFSVVFPHGSVVLLITGFILLIFHDKFYPTKKILSTKESRIAFFFLLVFASLFVSVRAVYGLELAKYKLKLSPLTHSAAGYFLVTASTVLFSKRIGRARSILLGVLMAFIIAVINETVDYFAHAGFLFTDILWWIPGISVKLLFEIYGVKKNLQEVLEFEDLLKK